MSTSRAPLAPARFPDLPKVKGVQSATASRGFYRPRGLERDDVFLFTLAEGSHCGGVFTRSTTASADVLWCRKALEESGGKARTLVVNAGNSNAFTGPKGIAKNEATLSAITHTLGVPKTASYLAATGVIGEPLDNDNDIGELIPDMSTRLGPVNWLQAAKAFMTTDTFAKGAGTQLRLDDHTINIAGIAKGSGMIAPNMATMLAYIFTDAAIAPDLLQRLTAKAAAQSFNAVTVDGDTSTSDTFMIFATGAAGTPFITNEQHPHYQAIEAALFATSLDLAQQLVRDGEGATKFISIEVIGTQNKQDAKAIAAAIANSPLVKTALAASDANWGRIVMAAGKSLIPFDQAKLAIWFGHHQVAEAGSRSANYDEATASAICARPEINIKVSVGDGQASARIYTCDLTHAYIDINGAYRT